MNQKMNPSTKKKRLFGDDETSESDTDTSSSSSSSASTPSEKDKTSLSVEKDVELTVNKKYAKDYQDRKQREELRQIAQRRRENGLASDEDDGDDSSSDEDEDEDGKLLTNSVNLQFLKTIKALKKKDATIYDPNARFFDEDADDDDDASDAAGSKERRKPKKFKDVLRDQILEDMEKEEIDVLGDDTHDIKNAKLAYDEQQEDLRKAFLKSTNGDDSGDDNDEDWMIVKRKGVTIESEKDNLKIQKEFRELEQLSGSKKDSIDTFADPRGEVEDGEQFLIDFMKNKKWKDKEKDSNDDAMEDGAEAEDESSIEDLDRADDFEAQYNFRFEQAEAETATSGAALSIQTYARGQTINTIRRQDATRKEKRQARKERKEAERKAKEEQLKRLKNAKRQEMEQKLSQVKSVLGAFDEDAVDEAAIMKMLEGDFDPEQFEKAMQQAYGEDYYSKEDAEWKSDKDIRKALQADDDGDGVVGPDDDDGALYDDDNYDEGYEEEGSASNWEDDDNEEYVGGDNDPAETELEKKVKTKLQEELYKLDYEDIVAGIPTRFKYRQVEPNDYGLTTQEILLARDATLKQFVSLNKMAPYNENGEHLVGSRKRRKFREMLKQDLEEEMGKENPSESEPKEQQNEVQMETTDEPKKKRRRLKKGKKNKESSHGGEQQEGEPLESSRTSESHESQTSETKEKRSRKKKAKEATIDGVKENAFNENSDTSNKNAVEISPKGEDAVLLLDENTPDSKKKEKTRRKKKKTKKLVASLTKSRLASYGL